MIIRCWHHVLVFTSRNDLLSQDTDNNTILILLAGLRPGVPDQYNRACVPQSDIENAALRMAGLYYDRFPYLLDWSNGQGRTALHVAALKGNEEFAKVRRLHHV